MARYPNAVWKPLPQNSTQPRIKVVGAVLHTAVSNGTSLFTLFNGRSAGVESHFYVREDGTVEQYMDTNVRADCQLDGNSWLKSGTRYGFVSIETWDGGHPETTPWNAKQVASLVVLLAWLAKTHDFPVIKATGPQGTGIGWHAQFTTSSSSSALTWNHTHSCPAAPRIAQVASITAAVKTALVAPKPTVEESVAATAADAKTLWTTPVVPNRNDPNDPASGYATPAGMLSNIEATQDVDHARLGQVEKDVADVKATVTAASVHALQEIAALKAALPGLISEALASGVVKVEVTVNGAS